MAKVNFNCDSGANIHSCRSETLDTVKDLMLDEGEWESMTEEQKRHCVEQWAWEGLEIYWEDVEE